MVFKKSRRLGIRVPECHAQSPRLDPKNRSVQTSHNPSTWEVEAEPGIQGNPQLYMEFQPSRCCFKNNLTKHRIAASPSLSMLTYEKGSTQAQLCLLSSYSRPLTFSSQLLSLASAKQEGKEALFISCREAGSSKALLIWNDSTYRSLILQGKSGGQGSNVQKSTNNCYHWLCSIVHIEAVHTRLCQVTTRSRGRAQRFNDAKLVCTYEALGSVSILQNREKREAREEGKERRKAGGTSS